VKRKNPMSCRKVRRNVVLETSHNGVTWQRARAVGLRSVLRRAALAALKIERRPSHGR